VSPRDANGPSLRAQPTMPGHGGQPWSGPSVSTQRQTNGSQGIGSRLPAAGRPPGQGGVPSGFQDLPSFSGIDPRRHGFPIGAGTRRHETESSRPTETPHRDGSRDRGPRRSGSNSAAMSTVSYLVEPLTPRRSKPVRVKAGSLEWFAGRMNDSSARSASRKSSHGYST
jgi:hypothetical protein